MNFWRPWAMRLGAFCFGGDAMVVDFEEALGIVLAAASTVEPGAPERVPLLDSAGRVLAEAAIADRDQPPFDRATRDGFAIRAAVSRAPLKVAGILKAGQLWPGQVPEGEAVQIMTGAPLPSGTDAVVMVEHVARDGDMVSLATGRVLDSGENVVPRGAEARAGEAVLAEGTRMGAAEIALAASCGHGELSVFRRPRIAIVSTGDELVEVAETPRPHQIRNSNSYGLAALVALAGGSAERLPIARDTLDEIRERIRIGREADLLVLSGGVSMGEYDLVEAVLEELGAEFYFTGVRMQPGKPVVFGRLGKKYFFGLPGNPISTQVTFHCFVEPMARALAGEADRNPRWAQATLVQDVAGKPGLTRVLPARMDGIALRVVGWQGSGDLAANARANCYVKLLPGRNYRKGEVVRVLLR